MIFNKDPKVMKAMKQIALPTSTTKVAAVMFTDIVGYTRVMESDQGEAMKLLEINRNLQQHFIQHYGGTWIKEVGDGILASFTSANDAVECSLKIQDACKNIPGLQLRIGIHLGEVVFTNNDVFGIVVNIASRLQCLAKPSQILVSASIAKRIDDERNYQVNLVGSRRLKNVKQSIQVHRVGALNESERITWWSLYSMIPLQKVVTVALMIASMFRL